MAGADDIWRTEAQYLAMVHPLTLERLHIPWERSGEYLRHYYVQDARQYVDTKNKPDGASHLNSANYVNEFQRLRFLMGEIPRKTCCATFFAACALCFQGSTGPGTGNTGLSSSGCPPREPVRRAD